MVPSVILINLNKQDVLTSLGFQNLSNSFPSLFASAGADGLEICESAPKLPVSGTSSPWTSSSPIGYCQVAWKASPEGPLAGYSADCTALGTTWGWMSWQER